MIIAHARTYRRHLPTPPVQFWQAWLVVRNYLLIYHGMEVFKRPPLTSFTHDGVEFKQRYDLMTAFYILDHHYDRFIAAEEDEGIVD